MTLPTTETSYWLSSVKPVPYQFLAEDVEVDVAIVGGGIAGLTTAYVLKNAGYSVAVIEKNTIGSGTSGGTTGKVTSQHGLIYSQLYNRYGNEIARTYAEANQTALLEIKKLIKNESIACDFTHKTNYVYTTRPEKVAEFQTEANLAQKLGLPARFETTTELPFETKAAVAFDDQATLHIQKYLYGLAERVHGQGSYVFEHSNVVRFHDGTQPRVQTKLASIYASHVVIATKIPAAPLVARGGYALLEHPHTSYVIAGETSQNVQGMYISPDKQHYSIMPVASGQKQLLLIGGEAHTPGLGMPSKRYAKLAMYGEQHFGIVDIKYRWKAMDYLGYDDIPLIGKLYPWSKHAYTATGFKKWGLTTSMVAAMILRDTLAGTQNPWTETFDSMRSSPITSIPRVMWQGIKKPFEN